MPRNAEKPDIALLYPHSDGFVELAFRVPPETPVAVHGLDYPRKPQDQMKSAHTFARDQLAQAVMRLKRNYDVTTK